MRVEDLCIVIRQCNMRYLHINLYQFSLRLQVGDDNSVYDIDTCNCRERSYVAFILVVVMLVTEP